MIGFIKKTFKENWKKFIFFAVLNLGLFLYDGYIYEDVEHKKLLPLVLVFFTLLEFLLVVFYYKLKAKNWKIEKIFLALAIPLGVLHAFITPINQVPDEIVHIMRAEDVSEGKFVSPRNNGEYYRGVSSSAFKLFNNAQSDRGYYKTVKNQILEPTSPDLWYYGYDSTTLYRPIAYVPQATGLAVGRFFRIPAGMTIYIGRICSVLLFALIVFFAIKLTPKFKEFFVIFGLLPLTLQHAGSFSVDSMVIASCFLMIALAMKYAYGEDKKLGIKELGLITFVSYFSAATKSLLYLPLGLLLVLIPARKFKKPILKYVFLAFLVVLSLGVYKLWLNMQEPAPAVVATTSTESLTDTVVTEQPSKNPFKFLVIAFGNIFGINTESLLNSTVGTSLSYYTMVAPAGIYIYIFIALLVVMIIRSSEKIAFRKLDKLIIWVTPIIMVLAMYYVAYYEWKYIDGGRLISGVNGRYIVPFLPLIPFMFCSKKEKKTEPLNLDYVFLFAIFSNAIILSMKVLHNF